MPYDIAPFRSGARLPREIQQALGVQDHAALARANKIRNIGIVTQGAMVTVAALTQLESQLIKAAPGAELRLDAICGHATIAIAAEVARMAF